MASIKQYRKLKTLYTIYNRPKRKKKGQPSGCPLCRLPAGFFMFIAVSTKFGADAPDFLSIGAGGVVCPVTTVIVDHEQGAIEPQIDYTDIDRDVGTKTTHQHPTDHQNGDFPTPQTKGRKTYNAGHFTVTNPRPHLKGHGV